jgi:hypothetical protein
MDLVPLEPLLDFDVGKILNMSSADLWVRLFMILVLVVGSFFLLRSGATSFS